MMTIREAKQVSIVSFLAASGYNPVEERGDGLWYCSPFRLENSPSFKVNVTRNIWYDHGAGTGGTIIDLVAQLRQVDASGALSVLRSQSWPDAAPLSFSFHPPSFKHPTRLTITVRSVKLLNNRSLIQYTESRRIPISLARIYLYECYYNVGEKSYFALAFANDQGGYELRNRLWQGASSPKAITTLPIEGSSTVSVFEGFFDLLSALVYFGKDKPAHTVVVLNSVALLDTALPTLQQYKRVHLFLDNDNAGRTAVEVIKTACHNVVDYATQYYPQHKDFNELLMKPTP